MNDIAKVLGSALLFAVGVSTAFSSRPSHYGSLQSLVTLNQVPNCAANMAAMIYNNHNVQDVSTAIFSCQNFINQTYPPYQFTPMHLSVIANNTAAISILHHEFYANINAPDILGFTPLHHAGLKGESGVASQLIEWNARPETKNNWQGTYADLLRFQAPLNKNVNATLKLHEIFFSAHKNNEITIDPQCQFPRVKYTNENVAESTLLIALWKRMAKAYVADAINQPIENNEQHKQYEEYSKKPAPLSIVPVKEFDKLGCGVYSTRAIREGEIIAEYTGKAVSSPTEVKNEDYMWSNDGMFIDSDKYRSPAAMINSGFPNSQFALYREEKGGIHGFPVQRVVIKALEDIPEGQQITINYGTSYYNRFKEKGYKELNPESRNQFIREGGLKKKLTRILNMMKNGINPKNQTTLEEKFLNNILYVLTTPFCLKELVEVNLVTHEDLNYLEKNISGLTITENGILIIKQELAMAKSALKKQKEL